MASHDMYEMMSTLRAVRRLRTDPIPADVLDRVLQAACWAPTGGNMQPWRVIVVRSPERKAALADLYGPEWTKYTAFSRKHAENATPEEAAKRNRMLSAGDYLAEHLASNTEMTVDAAKAILIASPKVEAGSVQQQPSGCGNLKTGRLIPKIGSIASDKAQRRMNTKPL